MARPAAYVDPGVYIDEVVAPGGTNAVQPPFVLGLVGRGLRTKRVTNDAIQRGLTTGEVVAFAPVEGTVTSISAPVSGVVTIVIPGNVLLPGMRGMQIRIGTPTSATNTTNNGSFTILDVPTAGSLRITNPAGVSEGAVASFSISYLVDALANLADNRVSNTSVRRGSRVLADSQVAFVPAYVLGTVAGPINLGTNNAFSIELDDRRAVTIRMLDGTARVHAAVAATAANTFPGPITNPAIPARIAVTFGAGWDGGNVTITGTNAAGASIVEALTPVAPGVVVTSSAFATVTDIAKASIGLSAATATVGTYNDVVVTGTLLTTYTLLGPIGPTATSATLAEIAVAVNAALGASSIYGSAYAEAALDWTTGLLIRATRNVRVFSAIANDATTALFGTAGLDNRDARSWLRISPMSYNATATYTVDYVRVRSTEDLLPQSTQGDVQSITRVGSTSGAANFTEGDDYARVNNYLSWDLGSTASFTSTVGTVLGNGIDLTTNTDIAFGVDGGPIVTFRLNGLASPPIGYANPAVPADALASEIAANVNAILAADANYGPRYSTVASTVTVGGLSYLVLTGLLESRAGSLQLRAPTSLSAMQTVFGLGATSLPFTRIGAGARPADGVFYFASYEITRPTEDYASQKRYFSVDAARADLGPASSENPLQVAVELAFRHGISSLCVSQVNDASTPGDPTRAEYLAALQATERSDIVTDVVMLTPDLASQIDLKDHIENQSSGQTKHYRRGWFGMARNTPIGDTDTPDTFVYRATRTLAYAPNSSGRGRAILVAPPQLSGVSIDIQLEDGTTERMECDSTFLAVAWAARSAGLPSPADELAQRTVIGFNVDDVLENSLWLGAERGELARNGVFVTTYDAGNFKNLDPVTVEMGFGRKNAFAYTSGSKQKDALRRRLGAAMAANLVGVVPEDPQDFVTDVRLLIAEVIRSAITDKIIGPYRNSSGARRDISVTVDIQVSDDPNDGTTFYFKYWFYIRYAALRLFGEFSVDAPFFSASV